MNFSLIMQLIILVIPVAWNPYIFLEILRTVKHRKFAVSLVGNWSLALFIGYLVRT